MKIGIVNNAANYLEFNVNLIKYLQKSGHELIYLNPDYFIKRVVKKYGIECLNCGKDSHPEAFYSPDHKLIRYYMRNYRLGDSDKLIRNKNMEYTACKKKLKNAGFDQVLILNGLFNVETDVCRELGIKTFFFEHGYFPKSIQMDPAGVNADASFADLNHEAFLEFTYPEKPFEPDAEFTLDAIQHNEKIRAFYRLIDPRYNRFLINFINKKRNQDKAKKRFHSTKPETIKFDAIGKYVFFPLQVNSDTQVILNSPYDSMYAAVEYILPRLLDAGYKVIIKEHPMEVEPVDYSRFVDNEHVFLTKKVDLNELIKKSEFVVNINSSVGLQSVALYKKVLLLGKAFYKNNPSCFSVDDYSSPDELFDAIDSATPDKKTVDAYVEHFKKKIFIPGHFYSCDTAFLERIRNRLEGMQ
jgi:capsular polysaccharide export protein